MPRRTITIAWLPGDGIGPEITCAALDVMHAAADASNLSLDVEEHPIGGAAIDVTGTPFPDETYAACLDADAVFLGAVGGPTWDALTEDQRPESGLLALRKALGAYANLRPVAVLNALVDASPLRAERVRGADILIVRELTGGIYFGTPREMSWHAAFNTMRYSREEIRRIARVAFKQARRRSGRVTSVDKANVLDVSRFWRTTVTQLHKESYPDVELEHLYVDNAAMQLVLSPRSLDVVLTGNLFGDILSDLAATLPGSLGLLPSASLGGRTPLFEPVHGSAPDLAKTDTANPIAAILCGAMLFDELDEPKIAEAIRRGISNALADGYRTPDLWRKGFRKVSTSEISEQIAQHAREVSNAQAEKHLVAQKQ